MIGARLLLSTCLFLVLGVTSAKTVAADSHHDGFKWYMIPDEILAGIGETLNQPLNLENKYISTEDLQKLVPDTEVQKAKKNLNQSTDRLTKLNKTINKRGKNSSAGKKAVKQYKNELKVFKKAENNYLKASQSNSRTRLNKVNRFNKNIKIIGQSSKGVIVKYGGAVLSITDGGSKVVGRFYEGDYSGGSAVLIDEAAKAGTSTIGVYSGGVAGATAGTLIGGPPGAIIGGAIGAIGGAVVSSSAYNYFVGKKLHKLSERYLASAPELTPLEKAKKSRKEHLEEKRRQEALKLEVDRMADSGIEVTDFWSTTDDLGEQGVSLKSPFPDSDALLKKMESLEEPPGRKDPGSVDNKKQQETSGRRKEAKQQKQELEKKADRVIAQGGISTETVHDGVPVIPLNCTIDITAWPERKPQARFSYSLDIRDGEVFGKYSHTLPAKDYSNEGVNKQCSAWTLTFRTTGTLDTNILRTVAVDNDERGLRCTESGTRSMQEGEEWVDRPYTCNSVYRQPSRSTALTALNIDGSLTMTVTTTSDLQISISGNNCAWSENAMRRAWQEAGAYDPVTTTFVGLWEIRN